MVEVTSAHSRLVNGDFTEGLVAVSSTDGLDLVDTT
jgi:hypothetical protein